MDTHVWIWLHSEPEKLSPSTLEELQSTEQIALSTISIYETMVAIEKGRIATEVEPATLVRRWLQAWDIARIPVSDEIVMQSRALAFDHADPFDRLIAATAIQGGMSLVTADTNLLRLGWLTTIPAQ